MSDDDVTFYELRLVPEGSPEPKRSKPAQCSTAVSTPASRRMTANAEELANLFTPKHKRARGSSTRTHGGSQPLSPEAERTAVEEIEALTGVAMRGDEMNDYWVRYAGDPELALEAEDRLPALLVRDWHRRNTNSKIPPSRYGVKQSKTVGPGGCQKRDTQPATSVELDATSALLDLISNPPKAYRGPNLIRRELRDKFVQTALADELLVDTPVTGAGAGTVPPRDQRNVLKSARSLAFGTGRVNVAVSGSKTTLEHPGGVAATTAWKEAIIALIQQKIDGSGKVRKNVVATLLKDIIEQSMNVRVRNSQSQLSAKPTAFSSVCATVCPNEMGALETRWDAEVGKFMQFDQYIDTMGPAAAVVDADLSTSNLVSIAETVAPNVLAFARNMANPAKINGHRRRRRGFRNKDVDGGARDQHRVHVEGTYLLTLLIGRRAVNQQAMPNLSLFLGVSRFFSGSSERGSLEGALGYGVTREWAIKYLRRRALALYKAVDAREDSIKAAETRPVSGFDGIFCPKTRNRLVGLDNCEARRRMEEKSATVAKTIDEENMYAIVMGELQDRPMTVDGAMVEEDAGSSVTPTHLVGAVTGSDGSWTVEHELVGVTLNGITRDHSQYAGPDDGRVDQRMFDPRIKRGSKGYAPGSYVPGSVLDTLELVQRPNAACVALLATVQTAPLDVPWGQARTGATWVQAKFAASGPDNGPLNFHDARELWAALLKHKNAGTINTCTAHDIAVAAKLLEPAYSDKCATSDVLQWEGDLGGGKRILVYRLRTMGQLVQLLPTVLDISPHTGCLTDRGLSEAELWTGFKEFTVRSRSLNASKNYAPLLKQSGCTMSARMPYIDGANPYAVHKDMWPECYTTRGLRRGMHAVPWVSINRKEQTMPGLGSAWIYCNRCSGPLWPGPNVQSCDNRRLSMAEDQLTVGMKLNQQLRAADAIESTVFEDETSANQALAETRTAYDYVWHGAPLHGTFHVSNDGALKPAVWWDGSAVLIAHLERHGIYPAQVQHNSQVKLHFIRTAQRAFDVGSTAMFWLSGNVPMEPDAFFDPAVSKHERDRARNEQWAELYSDALHAFRSDSIHADKVHCAGLEGGALTRFWTQSIEGFERVDNHLKAIEWSNYDLMRIAYSDNLLVWNVLGKTKYFQLHAFGLMQPYFLSQRFNGWRAQRCSEPMGDGGSAKGCDEPVENRLVLGSKEGMHQNASLSTAQDNIALSGSAVSFRQTIRYMGDSLSTAGGAEDPEAGRGSVKPSFMGDVHCALQLLRRSGVFSLDRDRPGLPLEYMTEAIVGSAWSFVVKGIDAIEAAVSMCSFKRTKLGYTLTGTVGRGTPLAASGALLVGVEVLLKDAHIAKGQRFLPIQLAYTAKHDCSQEGSMLRSFGKCLELVDPPTLAQQLGVGLHPRNHSSDAADSTHCTTRHRTGEQAEANATYSVLHDELNRLYSGASLPVVHLHVAVENGRIGIRMPTGATVRARRCISLGDTTSETTVSLLKVNVGSRSRFTVLETAEVPPVRTGDPRGNRRGDWKLMLALHDDLDGGPYCLRELTDNWFDGDQMDKIETVSFYVHNQGDPVQRADRGEAKQYTRTRKAHKRAASTGNSGTANSTTSAVVPGADGTKATGSAQTQFKRGNKFGGGRVNQAMFGGVLKLVDGTICSEVAALREVTARTGDSGPFLRGIAETEEKTVPGTDINGGGIRLGAGRVNDSLLNSKTFFDCLAPRTYSEEDLLRSTRRPEFSTCRPSDAECIKRVVDHWKGRDEVDVKIASMLSGARKPRYVGDSLGSKKADEIGKFTKGTVDKPWSDTEIALFQQEVVKPAEKDVQRHRSEHAACVAELQRLHPSVQPTHRWTAGVREVWQAAHARAAQAEADTQRRLATATERLAKHFKTKTREGKRSQVAKGARAQLLAEKAKTTVVVGCTVTYHFAGNGPLKGTVLRFTPSGYEVSLNESAGVVVHNIGRNNISGIEPADAEVEINVDENASAPTQRVPEQSQHNRSAADPEFTEHGGTDDRPNPLAESSDLLLSLMPDGGQAASQTDADDDVLFDSLLTAGSAMGSTQVGAGSLEVGVAADATAAVDNAVLQANPPKAAALDAAAPPLAGWAVNYSDEHQRIFYSRKQPQAAVWMHAEMVQVAEQEQAAALAAEAAEAVSALVPATTAKAFSLPTTKDDVYVGTRMTNHDGRVSGGRTKAGSPPWVRGMFVAADAHVVVVDTFGSLEAHRAADYLESLGCTVRRHLDNVQVGNECGTTSSIVIAKSLEATGSGFMDLDYTTAVRDQTVVNESAAYLNPAREAKNERRWSTGEYITENEVRQLVVQRVAAGQQWTFCSDAVTGRYPRESSRVIDAAMSKRLQTVTLPYGGDTHTITLHDGGNHTYASSNSGAGTVSKPAIDPTLTINTASDADTEVTSLDAAQQSILNYFKSSSTALAGCAAGLGPHSRPLRIVTSTTELDQNSTHFFAIIVLLEAKDGFPSLPTWGWLAPHARPLAAKTGKEKTNVGTVMKMTGSSLSDRVCEREQRYFCTYADVKTVAQSVWVSSDALTMLLQIMLPPANKGLARFVVQADGCDRKVVVMPAYFANTLRNDPDKALRQLQRTLGCQRGGDGDEQLAVLPTVDAILFPASDCAVDQAGGRLTTDARTTQSTPCTISDSESDGGGGAAAAAACTDDEANARARPRARAAAGQTSTHWFGTAIFPKTKYIGVYNSSSGVGDHAEIFAAARKLITAAGTLGDVDDWTNFEAPTPQQLDCVSCGVYTVLFLRCIAYGVPIAMQHHKQPASEPRQANYNQTKTREAISELRIRLASEIISGTRCQLYESNSVPP